MAASFGNFPNPSFASSVLPYDSTYKDCSQGLCSLYCPQWCYIVFSPPPPFSPGSDNDSGADFSPLIIAVIGILASAFVLLSYYTIISKYCRRRSSNDNARASTAEGDSTRQTTPSDQSLQPTSGGLEEGLIRSIRVYKYKKREGFVEGTDCSVCLSEFEENERLRLLPKCNHAFHVPCIDTWLKSHSSCPLCRSNIAPFVPQSEVVISYGGGVVSALAYQSRGNESVVVVVEDNLGVGVREEEEEEEVYGGDAPKTPTGGVEIINDQVDDHGEIRRSVSLNCHTFCRDRLSVADILRGRDDDDEEDLVVQMENGFQLRMGIGTSSNGEVDDLISGNGALGLLRSPLAMKRSI